MASHHLDALFAGLPDKLKVQQVADLLGISTQGAYKWLENGSIPGYKLGGKWFILRDELKEAMRQGSNAFADTDDPDQADSSGETPGEESSAG